MMKILSEACSPSSFVSREDSALKTEMSHRGLLDVLKAKYVCCCVAFPYD
jgi:hypothetical protein